jgi:uncharacterized membrane protein
MRRIYFLAPNIESTHKIVDDLRLASVEEKHIYVIGKQDIFLEKMPEASFLQKSDFIPALEQGLALGAATGLLCGLVALVLPTGLVLGGGAVFAISMSGAGIGALSSTLIGISTGSRRIEQFQAAIDGGEFLMMVDVDMDRVEEIEAIIKKHHPEAKCEGTEPHTIL